MSLEEAENSMSFRARNAMVTYWQKVVGIATGLSVIVGVAISVSHLAALVEDNKRASTTNRLQALQQIQSILREDDEIRSHARQFLRDSAPVIQPNVDALIRTAGTGEDFYLSPAMKDFAIVHHHYEQLGALVKLGYIDFPLVFEVIPFPDGYMHTVQPIRDALTLHWRGIGQRPLRGFGSNIDYLQACFEYSRAHPAAPPQCPDQTPLTH
ncbi:hypothetical protein [Roseateles terrae]|uniref:Uncharacterized protein n=1 Tax=Roseateles terrae TaxID=431060 RepID=A0ABR6GP73_9BURK|nr:hypothetical protein [Roseateles terrae]MBB3193913.1 hypothetical protein [Roseateles terrae]OWQ87794.1 hypothetical protein CDN98_06410 [Roseateles terrae]